MEIIAWKTIKKICFLICFMSLVNNSYSSSGTMKNISSAFIKVLHLCKDELNLTDRVIAEMYHFWKEDYSLLSRDVGCMVICMSQKLNLLDEDGKLHHGNAQEFAQGHGADQTVATQLVGLLHACEKNFETIEDSCSRVLEVAKCFRTRIHELNWTPDFKVILEEVATDV